MSETRKMILEHIEDIDSRLLYSSSLTKIGESSVGLLQAKSTEIGESSVGLLQAKSTALLALATVEGGEK